MRRMYSQAELSAIIKEVFLQDVADGQIDLPALVTESLADIDWSEFELDCKSVKADSIIENMSGYAFNDLTHSEITIEYVYAGAVKNGNKLTLAVAMKATPTDTTTALVNICKFSLPEDVLDKLFGITIAGYGNSLAVGEISFYQYLNAPKRMPYLLQKGVGGVSLAIYNSTTWTANTEYYGRFEITFLLSDNLSE